MRKSTRKIVRRTAGIAAGVILAGGLITVGTAYKNVRTAANNMYAYAANHANEGRNLNSLLQQKKAINILIVGTGKGQGDAFLMMAVNPQTNSAKVVSVPKNETMKDGSSITADYAKGGVSGTMTALHNTYSTPIDAYVTINVNGLANAVNKVGGIEVNGQHMNGQEAVNFARGNNSNDYSKTILPVFKGILTKTGSFSALFNADYLNALSNDMQSDLTFDQLTKFGLNYASAAKNASTSVATNTSAVTATINGELK